MEDHLKLILWQPRLVAWFAAAFALVASFLALVGIYGTISHMINQRRFEIGVRLALGANPQQIAALVLGRTVSLVAMGLAPGAVGAVAAGRMIRRLLYETPVMEPFAFLAVPAALLLVAVLAGCRPALRAARISPASALRAE
jgi:ABC-type antimicrobial peptide transport system permease subunit